MVTIRLSFISDIFVQYCQQKMKLRLLEIELTTHNDRFRSLIEVCVS